MNRQMGFSIIEIMIGIAIGLVVIALAGTFFVSTLRSNIEDARQQRFVQTIQILKSMIVSTIRRAGFSNSTSVLPNVAGWTSGSHYYTNGSCALVTYVDMSLPSPKQQFFGYKLDTATGILYSYQADNKVDCNETATWQAMNDPTQIKLSPAPADSLFSSPTNPKLVQIHFIAEDIVSKSGIDPVSQEVLVKVYIRNN